METDLVTEEELLPIIKANTRQLREMRYLHKIPYVRYGHRTLRYSISAVLRALKKLEIKEV